MLPGTKTGTLVMGKGAARSDDGGRGCCCCCWERKGGCSGKRTLLVYKTMGAIVFLRKGIAIVA